MPKKAHFPGVNRVRRRDAVYFYHRATGSRLPDDYGSPAFARAWAEAEARAARPLLRLTDPSSYAGLIDAFKESAEWKALKPRTQSDYQRCIDWMSKQGSDARPAGGLTQARCEKLLDLAVKERGWRGGLYILQFNRRLYAWVMERSARKRTWGEVNPWADIKPPQRPRNTPRANRAWEPWEVAEVLSRAPVGLARAYVLGASGMDGSTLWEARWAEYQNGGFAVDRGKTGAEGFSLVPRPLRLFLDEGERPSEFIVTTEGGEQFANVNSLQTQSSEFLRGLAKDGQVGAGLTLHGLRHTIGKAVADSGGSLHAIQAALQHKSSRMALHYSNEADRKRALLASADAVDKWFGLQNLSDADSKTPPEQAGNDEKLKPDQ